MKSLIKHTSTLVAPKIFRFLIGIIRAKLNAVFIGTTGVGVTSQIEFASLRISRFVLLGMNDGLVKQIAERKALTNVRESIIISFKSYLLLITSVIFFAMLLLLIFKNFFSQVLFGSSSYIKYYYVAISIIPLIIIQSSFFAILKAYTASKQIARSEFLSILFSFIVFVPAVYFYGLKGAVVVVVLKFLFLLIFTACFAIKKFLNPLNITFFEILKAPIKRNRIYELTLFAGVGLSVGLTQMFTELYNRSLIVNKLGISQLGLYTPNVAWGGLFISFVIPAMYTYLFAKFSELKDDKVKLIKLLNDAYRIVLTLVIPFLVVGIGFRAHLINLFYSKEFIEAAKYLPIHFLGIFFTALMETTSQIFTPTGYIRINAFIMMIKFIIQVVIVSLLITKIGLYSYALAFLVPPFIALLIMHYFLKKKFNFYIKKVNVFLFILALVSVGTVYTLSEFSSVIFTSLFLCLVLFMLYKSINKDELNTIKQFLYKWKIND